MRWRRVIHAAGLVVTVAAAAATELSHVSQLKWVAILAALLTNLRALVSGPTSSQERPSSASPSSSSSSPPTT